MSPSYIILLLLLALGMILSVWYRKLTPWGAFTGGVLGLLVYSGGGFTGIIMMGTFFLLGVLATSWNSGVKEKLGLSERDLGRRTAGQVLANGAVAGLLGLQAVLFPDYGNLFLVMLASSLSSATADTLSSEMGTIYGRKFFNILTWKKDKRGANGVVSAEGTLFGLLGSSVIALVYAIGIEWSMDVLWIIIAGTIGNMVDSILGASLERKHILRNDGVNLLNTLAGALAGGLLFISTHP